MWAAIDAFRRTQPDRPTRSEAVRRVLVIGLELMKAGRTQRKRK